MLRKVISGGQTGADRAALIAAKRLGIPTGGHMPNSFLALDGIHPEFATLYGMEETPQSTYPPRTRLNVWNSDATLRMAMDWTSAGERLTFREVQAAQKPLMDLTCAVNWKTCVWRVSGVTVQGRTVEDPSTDRIVDWLSGFGVLNVAGNRADVHSEFQLFCLQTLSVLFRRLKERG